LIDEEVFKRVDADSLVQDEVEEKEQNNNSFLLLSPDEETSKKRKISQPNIP
jgi:hypothetical protein